MLLARSFSYITKLFKNVINAKARYGTTSKIARAPSPAQSAENCSAASTRNNKDQKILHEYIMMLYYPSVLCNDGMKVL